MLRQTTHSDAVSLIRVGALQGFASAIEDLFDENLVDENFFEDNCFDENVANGNIAKGTLTKGRSSQSLLQGLLNEVGLKPSVLDDADTLIPFTKFEALLERTASRLNCPDFGMRLAGYQDLTMLGAVGVMMMRCQSVKEVIRYAQHYMSLHVHAEYWEVRIQGELCSVTRYQHHRIQESKGQNAELSMAVCYGLLRQLLGADFNLLGVHFSHRPISTASTYSQYFAAPVSFNQEYDQVFFSAKVLDWPLPPVDPLFQKALKRRLDEQLAMFGDDLERKVRSLILAGMASQSRLLDHVAQLMNLHPRTLQRRLKQRGLSFQALVNEIKMEAAAWALSSSQMSLIQVSQMLGYGDQSAFNKAFQRMYGKGPRAWRKAQWFSKQDMA